ncbi:MAG: helix-turn-helix domain-containing protein [Chloroflexi bacterium]|nr:helix-turn-helix domain-containing protein [Chloroflexota bacterium]
MVAKSQEAAPDSSASAQELADALRALGNRYRLAILRLLDSGELSVGEMAGALGLSATQTRRHLGGLVAAGLVDPLPADGAQRFQLNRRAAALLNASVVALLGRAGASLSTLSAPFRGVDDVLPVAVPSAPQACLQCQNSAFVREVLDDLDRILADARQYQSRLQHLSSQVLSAHEAERKRIARELHDDTAQALTSILVRLRLLERSVENGNLRQSVEELRDLTGSTLDSVRRMAVDLRPTALDDLGLVAALRSYVEKFSTRWPISIEFSSNGLQRRLPAEVELVLYRIAQEALSNVAKHSGARSVQVALSRRRNVVTAVVSDDGRGFDVDKVIGSRRGGLGLFGMKERLALVGGSLQIEVGDRGGTQITARVPLPGLSHRHN